MAALVLLASVAFASTNLDDFFVLLALFADPTLPRRQIVAGQVLGMAALALIALACALALASVPGPTVGLLGLLPLLIGLRRVLRRRAPEQDAIGGTGGSAGTILMAAAITAANGGDNIAVYVPLFVGRSGPEIAVVAVVFSALTTVWCVVAQGVVAHPRGGAVIKRLGPRCLPWLFIGLGLYLLLASRAYTLLSR